MINANGDASGLCSICLVEYTGAPSEIFVGYIKACGHYFHFDCIWTWLESRGNCPLCRQKVLLKEEDIRGFSLKHVLLEYKDKMQDGTPDHTWTTVSITSQSAPPSGTVSSNNSSDIRPAPPEETPTSSGNASTTITCSVEIDNPAFENTDGDATSVPNDNPVWMFTEKVCLGVTL